MHSTVILSSTKIITNALITWKRLVTEHLERQE